MRIVHAKGQMCNQFWILSNYLTDAIINKNRIEVWCPDFDLELFDGFVKSEYISVTRFYNTIFNFFENKKNIKSINRILSNDFLLKIIQIVSKIIPKFKFEVVDVGCPKNPYKEQYINHILNTFSPNEQYLSEVDRLFLVKKKQDEIVVGVHIRYGDYKTYLNGKYYYSLYEYKRIMHNIEAALDSKYNVKFFISSNEDIDYTIFGDMNFFTNEKPWSILDMVGLSKCDYICGPPSTFSAWASLYNNTPLYFIENVEKKIAINDFFYIKDIWF